METLQKQLITGTLLFLQVTDMDISSNKDEEENSMHNTVVLFSSSDKFTLHQVATFSHIYFAAKIMVFSFLFSQGRI